MYQNDGLNYSLTVSVDFCFTFFFKTFKNKSFGTILWDHATWMKNIIKYLEQFCLILLIHEKIDTFELHKMILNEPTT